MYYALTQKRKDIMRTQSAIIIAFTQTSNHSEAKSKDTSKLQSFLY